MSGRGDSSSKIPPGEHAYCVWEQRVSPVAGAELLMAEGWKSEWWILEALAGPFKDFGFYVEENGELLQSV